MGSKAFMLKVLAIFLVITSEAAARELAQRTTTSLDNEHANEASDAKFGVGFEGYLGGPDLSRPGIGGLPGMGGGRFGGLPGGGFGGGGRGYYGGYPGGGYGGGRGYYGGYPGGGYGGFYPGGGFGGGYSGGWYGGLPRN